MILPCYFRIVSLLAVLTGEGLNGYLRAHLHGLSPGRASCLLKRLRTHGLIKKIANRYTYYLTKLDRSGDPGVLRATHPGPKGAVNSLPACSKSQG